MSKKTKIHVMKETTCHNTVILGAEDIIRMLKKEGSFDNVPDNAAVYFRVPCGGDCSGEDIYLEQCSGNINQRSIVVVTWSSKIEK